MLDLVLGLKLCFDLFQFCMHRVVMCRSAKDADHGLASLVDTTSAVVIPGRLREEEDTNAQNGGEDPADADHNTPGARVLALVFVGAEVEAGGEEDAESDEELVGRNQSTTNPRRSGLGWRNGVNSWSY